MDFNLTEEQISNSVRNVNIWKRIILDVPSFISELQVIF